MEIIDGKNVASNIKAELKEKILEIKNYFIEDDCFKKFVQNLKKRTYLYYPWAYPDDIFVPSYPPAL